MKSGTIHLDGPQIGKAAWQGETAVQSEDMVMLQVTDVDHEALREAIKAGKREFILRPNDGTASVSVRLRDSDLELMEGSGEIEAKVV